MSAWVSPGTRCVCGHTIEQHAVRCEADDVICGCVRFRVVSPAEVWVCNDPGCGWSGPRVEVDSQGVLGRSARPERSRAVARRAYRLRGVVEVDAMTTHRHSPSEARTVVESVLYASGIHWIDHAYEVARMLRRELGLSDIRPLVQRPGRSASASSATSADRDRPE
jgi:hypothetical protein